MVTCLINMLRMTGYSVPNVIHGFMKRVLKNVGLLTLTNLYVVLAISHKFIMQLIVSAINELLDCEELMLSSETLGLMSILVR